MYLKILFITHYRVAKNNNTDIKRRKMCVKPRVLREYLLIIKHLDACEVRVRKGCVTNLLPVCTVCTLYGSRPPRKLSAQYGREYSSDRGHCRILLSGRRDSNVFCLSYLYLFTSPDSLEHLVSVPSVQTRWNDTNSSSPKRNT